MKIAFLVPYFHSDELEPYKKFSAGLAFTIESIIKNFGVQGHEVFVYAQSAFSKGYKLGNITFLPKRIRDIFPLPIFYLKEFFKDTKGQKMSLKYWIHVLSYYLYGDIIEKQLRKIKPDIASIRGVGYITRPYVLACKRTETKYVISLHGLISFLEGPTVLTTDREKAMEKEAFWESIEQEHPLTVIASGIKKRMLDELEIKECNSIFVVNNGVNKKNLSFDISDVEEIKKQYKISDKDKVIISAAHITERKNQIQVLRAYKLLNDDIKSHTKVLFLGTGDMESVLQQEIEKNGLQNSVFMCGFVENKRMGSYYALSNVNVIASKDEGFGRAFVEGFLYGVPAVAFSDLDAIKDLYDESAMVLVDNRTDEALAFGLESALSKNWDKKKIAIHGDTFSVESMARKYEAIYKRYLNGKLYI